MLAPLLATLPLASLAVAQSTLTAAPSPSQVARAMKRQASASALPLTEYSYSYGSQPYQVNPYASGRGPQSGYNICNSTTVGPDSQCQTALLNSIGDFCLWGSPTTDATGTIGDVEAAVVAYCTTDKWGTRVIPPGAITGLQMMRTTQYTQWVGHINQTALNLVEDDTGGELDPHGADLAGNPLGGLVYSSALPSGDNSTELQVIEWNNFIGSGVFCFKICDPSADANYCQNKFDLIGCSYNMPAAYEDGVFLECDGDLQDVAGTYTGTDGKTSTWSQPESLPATSTLPWTPRIPASSNCVTYQSSDIFAASDLGYQSTALSGSATATSAASTASSTSAASSRSGASSSGASATGQSAAAQTSSSTTTSGASSLVASTGLVAVVLGALVALA
ncbi:hypothetical protein JCM10207_008395 [Rhodosporidiobolus poonsookiae]